MRYGMCVGLGEPEQIGMSKKAGFDYIECGFCLLSRGEDEVFEAYKKALEENDIRCEAANGFFPLDLPLLGDSYDEKAVVDYMEKGMQRGVQIGLKTIVFGSSKARRIPDGMQYDVGFTNLAKVLRDVISPVAQKYGITIVTEPLRKDETNIINTVKEGAMLAAMSGKENISTLADIYHMVGVGDTVEDVRQLKGCIKHGHISNPYTKKGLKRDFPEDMDEFDYQGFIDALKEAGCETCSVEARCLDFESEVVLAGKLLKSLN